jgi:DNA-binding transcriptional LysR family regulator
VAETGSLAGAAEKLNVSSAAVSAGLAALERSMKAQLVVGRKSQGTQLTASGHRFYSEAKDILRMAGEAELSLAGEAEELVGPLSVGCFPTLAATVLPAVTKYFSEHHPRVTVSYTIKAQQQLIQKLILNELDCVLLYDLYLPEGIQKEHLKTVAVYVMVGSDHRVANRSGVTLKELESEPLVLFDADPANTHSFSIFQRAGVQPQIRYRGTEYELIRGMIAQGLGYSLMIHRPAHNLTYEGLHVAYVPIRPSIPDESIVGVWPANVNLNRRARKFIEVARDVLASSSLEGNSRPHTSVPAPGTE